MSFIQTSAAVIPTPVVQAFTGNGTYTPTAGMKYCIVEAWGGGGAAGGNPALAATQVCACGSGGSGAYVRALLTAAQIGTFQNVTIGTGGTGASNAAGGAGNPTLLGGLISAGGGGGGFVGTAATAAAGAGVTKSGGNGGTWSITTGVNIGSANGIAGQTTAALFITTTTRRVYSPAPAIPPGENPLVPVSVNFADQELFGNTASTSTLSPVLPANSGMGAVGLARVANGVVGAAAGGNGATGYLRITEFFV